ncbi:mitochondrial succinate-fumarate transporter 1 isoform A [Chlorella sorokiniana]|uniref:Ubiquinone biosynthesis monooxygenase COQ6, mitochondrial n=1 Tax=Chlorella sorokiniana TaxID=3076 RepID=A0A2P6U2W8_CHLSO|nr:mitochondrial succinate-fumarate transporter 1 isoform A [Chlorella sorokiniana]|eukprot:PRW60660.1 mitochondrial succinate-fumarate transporter 1 isoform A [Chlorella sorokiniana]
MSVTTTTSKPGDQNVKIVTVSPTVKAVAGSLGGVVEACMLQPIDVAKTRLQLDHSGQYKGMVHCIRTIAAQEGVPSLWKGLTPFLGQLTLKYALRMGSNAFFLELMRDQDGKLTQGARLMAGLGAGVSEALLIVTPFEVVKTRLQQQKGTDKALLKYRGPIHTAMTIAREEGVMKLWSGATATTIRQGSNQMSLFWGKALCDGIFFDKHEGDGKVLSPAQSAASGFVAACIGPTLNNPFDVVKTRMQAASKGGPQYSGFFDCLVTIAKTEGIAALWKGLIPRLARTPPGQAIVWSVSDQITGYFERQRRAAEGVSAMWGLRSLSTAAAAQGVVDVAIVGGGMTGAALAACLAANPLTKHLSVALLDKQPPVRMPAITDLPPHADLRVSTLTPASVALLRSVGAWRTLAPAAAPFCDMQVWDSGGEGFVRYDAASVDVMGYVVENRLTVAALHQRLSSSSSVQMMMPASIASAHLPPYTPVAQLDGGPLVQLQLEGGVSLQARLLVGADGRSSRVRQWAQIRTVGRDYGQRGVVATLATSWPNQTAFQRFLPTGPVALLPVRGGFSSLVWSCPPEMAARLEALPRHELAAAVTEALTGPPHYPPKPPLGSLLSGILAPARGTRFVEPPQVVDVVGDDPKSFPLTLAHAGRYVRPRVALIGDAAHGIHPLAGQGVNLGFGDVRALAAAIANAVETGQDIGSPAMLEREYEAPQKRVNSAMIAAMDGLKDIFQPQSGPVAGLRSLGLDLINSSPVAKRAILRIAMHGLAPDER